MRSRSTRTVSTLFINDAISNSGSRLAIDPCAMRKPTTRFLRDPEAKPDS